MPEIHAQSEDLTINSLVTKVVATVFVGTFATALLVGWIAIQSTRDFVERSIDERYPRAVDLAAQASATWLAAARARLEHAVAELSRAPSDAELAEALEKARGFEGIRICGSGAAERAAGLAPDCPHASRDAGAPLGWLATRRADGARQPAIATPLVAAERGTRFAIAAFERKRLVDLLGVHRPHPDALMLLASRSGEVLAGIGAGELPKRVDPAFARPSGDSSTPSAGSIWRRAIRMAHPIAGTPWHVVFEVPSSVVYSPLLVLIR
ncbi:MAG TPA: hypothetical protein VEC18_04745, partial [Myxococcota bacterium]|nr:hypothetical protein [Myxococcota bacterium]